MDLLIARCTVYLNVIILGFALAGLNIVLTKGQHPSAALPAFAILCNVASIRTAYRLRRLLLELDEQQSVEAP